MTSCPGLQTSPPPGGRRVGRTRRALTLAGGAALLSLSGCGALQPPPNAQSIAGLAPSGTVTLSENFVSGVGAGTGTLSYQGQSYPFRLAGTILGPGGGLQRINGAGEVYQLTSVADFAGPYAQSEGKPGVATSGGSDLWLQNKNGVIMHLQGSSTGVMLSLGRDEILVRMDQ
jgi:hypothetical protein